MVDSLRSAIELLKGIDGQMAYTDTEVDAHAEISGVYRHVGAGGTVMRPTKAGPALMFNNVKGFPDKRVVIGMLATRERVGYLLDCEPRKLGYLLKDAVNNPIPPVVIEGDVPCQEVVKYATDEDFDIRTILPAPQNTEEDAGPYITLGMAYAADPETGVQDVTIHRMCLQDKDEISIYMVPGGRHIGAMFEKAEALGQNLPISVSIGVDPAIEIASCFEAPTTPYGFDELQVAGSLRGKPVELCNCLSIKGKAIANAEFVIEGELLCGKRVEEDQNTHTGKAMPEFPGYTGAANPSVPIIKVKAVTYRKNPIIQTCIGPSEEHVSMAGIPTEASILRMLDDALPGRCGGVYCHSSGGGKYLAIIQFKKNMPSDEGRQRQAALIAFSAFSELKHVILVDDDVDIFDTNDVLWAMNTRFQGDRDIITIPGVRCHPLDPSERTYYNPLMPDDGISCKTVFDCTVPFKLKDKFQRSKFKDVDMSQYDIKPLV